MTGYMGAALRWSKNDTDRYWFITVSVGWDCLVHGYVISRLNIQLSGKSQHFVCIRRGIIQK